MTDKPIAERSSREWKGYPDDEVPPRELMRRLTWDMGRKIAEAVSK